jgi:hypothetical protein
VRALGLLAEVCDGSDRVVDRKKEGGETELGKSDLEKGLVDGSGGEDGDDALGGHVTRGTRRLETEGGVVSCKPVDSTLDVRVGEGLELVPELGGPGVNSGLIALLG